MASAQCNRSTNETCQQKCYGSSSLGQKMSSWVKGNHNTQQACKPTCQTQAQTYPNHVATSKTQTHCYSNQTTQAHQTGMGLAKPQQAQCAAGHQAHHTHTHTHGHGHSHTKHQATNGTCQCVNKTNCRHSQNHSHSHSHGHGHGHATNGAVCHGKTALTCEQKKERNLFRRIKDRISGNNSCSDSSSDSDSDNECCRQRKN